MKTSSKKAKGRRCCQEVKELLHAHAPELQQDDIHVTSSGETGEDLKLSPLARSKFPFTIECKNVEKLNIWDALSQCESHKDDKDYIPTLFFRRNRSKLYVALDAQDFMKLLYKVNNS